MTLCYRGDAIRRPQIEISTTTLLKGSCCTASPRTPTQRRVQREIERDTERYRERDSVRQRVQVPLRYTESEQLHAFNNTSGLANLHNPSHPKTNFHPLGSCLLKRPPAYQPPRFQPHIAFLTISIEMVRNAI